MQANIFGLSGGHMTQVQPIKMYKSVGVRKKWLFQLLGRLDVRLELLAAVLAL